MGLGGYLLLAILVLYAFIVGKISVRQLGIDYVALMIFGVIVLTVTLQRNRGQSKGEPEAVVALPDAKKREANRKSARHYMVSIVIMGAILVYGLWDSSDYPLWVTFIGAGINIGIIVVLVITVRSKLRLANHGGFSSER